MCSCDEHTTILTGLATTFLKRRHGVAVVVVWVVVAVTAVRWLMVVVTAVRWLVVVVTAVGWLVACTGSISLFIISLSFFSSLFSSTQHNIIPGMYSPNPPNFLSRVSVTLGVTLKSNAATLVFRNWCS
jgi:hypothetical protein